MLYNVVLFSAVKQNESAIHKYTPRQLSGKEFIGNPYRQGMWVGSLGWEDPLKKDMATHSSILALTLPWTPLPKSLQLGFLFITFICFLSHLSSPVNEGGIPSVVCLV